MFDPLAYGATPIKKTTKGFNPLEYGATPIKVEKTRDAGEGYASLVPKAIAQGTLSIADLPQTLLGLSLNRHPDEAGQAVYKRRMKGKTPTATSTAELAGIAPDAPDYVSTGTPISELVNQGAQNLTGVNLKPNPGDDSLKQIAVKGGEFLGGVGGVGAFSKAAGLSKLSNLQLGKQALSGGAVGLGSGALQQAGINPLVSDVVSTAVTPAATPRNLLNAFKNTGNALGRGTVKLGHKIAGISPSALKLDAAKAAADLGIDLPAATLTDRKLTSLVNQQFSKLPFAGDALATKYANTEKQTRTALDSIYDKIGLPDTPEASDFISKQYSKANKLLPSDIKTIPKNSHAAVNEFGVKSGFKSPEQKEVDKIVKEFKESIQPESKAKSAFGSIKLNTLPYEIEALDNTKKNLNKVIKWDIDDTYKRQLTKIRKGVEDDLAEYGKKNPEWYTEYQIANKLYGDRAKRKEVEKLLGRGVNYSSDSVSYGGLAKVINHPDTAKSIKRRVTPEILTKINKLGKVAETMAQNNNNIPNPSGTTPTKNALGLLGALVAGHISIPLTLGVGTAGYGITKLLTDKKFVDLAIKYAEGGAKNKVFAMGLNSRIKSVTGHSVVSFNNELQRMKKKQEEK